MPRETKIKTIDGLEIRCVQLPAMRAYALFTKLIGKFGPLIGALSGVDFGDDASKIQVAFGALSNLQADESTALAREVLCCTSAVVDGRMIDLTSDEAINSAFDGRLKTMLAVMWFALEVNFSSFLDDSAANPSSAVKAARVT